MPAKKQNLAGASPEYLVVGEILRPHGVRGEVRMRIVTAHPEHLSDLEILYLGPDFTPYRVQSMRRHQKALLLQFEGLHDRDAVESLRNQLVHVDFANAIPLEEGEVYLFQLLDMQVRTDDGRDLGRVVDVIETGANDVFVVNGPLGEVLLPDIPDVVLKLDVEAQLITVHLIDGLLNKPETPTQ